MQWSKWDSPAQKATVPHMNLATSSLQWPPNCSHITAWNHVSQRCLSPKKYLPFTGFCEMDHVFKLLLCFFPLVYCSESYFYTEWVHVICLQLPVCNAHFQFAQGTYLPCITQEFEHCPVLNRFTHSHGSCDPRCMTPTLQRGNWRTQKQMNEPKMWQTVKLERGTPSDLPQVSSYLPILSLSFSHLWKTPLN